MSAHGARRYRHCNRKCLGDNAETRTCSPINVTEEEIIKLIRNGGKAMDAGVKALYQGTAQHMLRFFVHRGLSGDEAKDVLQDTFVKIVRGAAGFTGEGTAKSWIWQIARNCLSDQLRSKLSLNSHETVFADEDWRSIEETTAAPAACATGISVDQCVAEGLAAFASQIPDRAYVLTLQMEGMSIDDIGTRIGRTVAATKEYLSQCKKKIQPFIAHCTELLAA